MEAERIPVDEGYIKKVLPRRLASSHKGNYGRLGILAGSSRYRGAALLAAEGALRAGAGIVQLASIEPVCAAASVRLPGCILLPVPEQYGAIAPEGALLLGKEAPDVILAGCGVGRTLAGAQLLDALLGNAACPLVLDADVLNMIAEPVPEDDEKHLWQSIHRRLAAFSYPVVKTPHIGEMARLTGLDKDDIIQNQQAVALQFSRQWNCILVLKSHTTVVADPNGQYWVNDKKGNPGMAKGGSGDVLAGVVASLLAQGVPPFSAAAAGVWLHAAAGDAAAEEYGYAGLLPADLPQALAGILRQLGR